MHKEINSTLNMGNVCHSLIYYVLSLGVLSKSQRLQYVYIYIVNICPTRCNTKQSIYYSASSLYVFRVSTTPVIRSTQNCNYSLRYWSYFLYSYLPPTWPSLATLEGVMTSTGGCSYSFVYSWWWVWLTPETRRVNLQNNKETALCCISLDNY